MGFVVSQNVKIFIHTKKPLKYKYIIFCLGAFLDITFFFLSGEPNFIPRSALEHKQSNLHLTI